MNEVGRVNPAQDNPLGVGTIIWPPLRASDDFFDPTGEERDETGEVVVCDDEEVERGRATAVGFLRGFEGRDEFEIVKM